MSDMSHQLQSNGVGDNNGYQGAYVHITEQPARCALRFRYECEGRSAGSIPGSSATPENKTYPTIHIQGYKGQAVVVVSCVTKDAPYRPHPHNLVGKEGCKKGVCTMRITDPNMTCSFTSLGIQCVKRKDIEESLKLRESIQVDPYRTGFAHKNQASNIDLNVVRLCFQAFLPGEDGKFNHPLPAVVSEPIYDKKAMSDLIITKLSHYSAPVTGGKEIILLCDRVAKDDLEVRFYEERNGQLVWEGFGEFQPNEVHKQVAISFRTPKYHDENVAQPVTVHIQLRRPSDGHTSESRQFQLLPKSVDPDGLTRKRAKIGENSALDRYMRENPMPPSMIAPSPLSIIPPSMDFSGSRSPFQPLTLDNSPRPPERIKLESIDQQAQQQQRIQQQQIQWNDLSQQSRLSGHSNTLASSPSQFASITPVPSPRSIPSPNSHLQQPLNQSVLQQQVHSILPHLIKQQPYALSQNIPGSQSSQQEHTSMNISHSPNGPLGQLHMIRPAAPYSSIEANTFNIPEILNDFDGNQPQQDESNMHPNQQFFLRNPNISNINMDGQPGTANAGPSSSNVNEFSNVNNNPLENCLTEKLDSLDIIDSSDLVADFNLSNLSNLMSMMDSENNLFTTSGNINFDTPNADNRAQNL